MNPYLSSHPSKLTVKRIPHIECARADQMVDFRKVREDLFSDASGQVSIEQVQVNQRHLIDKILARYSAEFTVYREMIQNANDAGAREVEIAFKRAEKGNLIESITVRNNGRPFNEDDWRRLKSIAEGNPDEQKIGFFGVGFYSLFSICEEPLVISGDRCLGFYWRGDQLYTRSGPVSGNENKNETCICLQLREPLDCPDLDHFSQFLGKAVLFTVNLQTALFSIDDKLQFKVEKAVQAAASEEFKLIPSSVLTSPKTSLFSLTSLQPQNLTINIDKRFESPEPSFGANASSSSSTSSFIAGLWRLAQTHLTEKGRQESAIEAQLRRPGQYSLQLKYLRGVADVKVPARFATEMERTTKKKPFSRVCVDMIWSSDASASDANINKHPVLKHLLPAEVGKVYIGFETHQSTGIGAHLAAPFIPTVERESIDFVDGCLKQWNIELLQLAGKLARCVFEYELRQAGSNAELLKKLLKTFNFSDSTPAPHVCITLFREFLDQKTEITLPAQGGKLVPVSQLRFIPQEMQSFMKNCPQVPPELEQACTLFLQRLQSSKRAALPNATHEDVVLFELKQRQLTNAEIISCIKWWSKNPPASVELNREFAKSLVIKHSHNNFSLALAQFSLCPVAELIALHVSEPDWLPFWPVDCLPAELAEAVGDSLRGLKSFTEAAWLEELANNSAARDAIQTDRDRAERLLLFCSKRWDHANEIDQGRIASVLASLACIPVASGALKAPRLCFFDDVAQDGLLPADSVLACSTDLRRSRLHSRMLKAAGVQSHLPLQSVLRWSAVASLSTIQYLFKHREELSRSELEQVRMAAIFPSSASADLFPLSQLYAPSAITKQLELPHLNWTDAIPREGSELGTFMEQLGFNYTVPWRKVLGGVAKCKNSAERDCLFRYFFEHYAEYESFRPEEVDFPFLPVEGEHDNLLLLPSQVFLNDEIGVLGFYLLARDLRKWASQLGVAERPSSALLAKQISKSRLKEEEAAKLFSYLSRVSFSASDIEMLSQSAFIPTANGFKQPNQVFLKSTSSVNEGGFSELFDQVDFGSAGNAFLRAVGVGDEPTIEHLVQLLCGGSDSIFASIGHVRYCKMMERLASGWSAFSRKNSGLAKSFAAAPVFVASVKSDSDVIDQDEEKEKDGQESIQYMLFKAKDAFLIDDTIAQQIFNLPAVPVQLNEFYGQLGCKWISSVVKTEWKRTGRTNASGQLALEVQKMLHDRLGLISSSLEAANRRGRKKVNSAKIYQVDAIKIARTCAPLKREDLQSVCAYTDGQDIYVAYSRGKDFDAFDLASVVVELLCEQKGRLQDALLAATLLTTPLSSLRAKGFKIKEAEIEEVKPEPAIPLPINAPTPNKPASPIIPEFYDSKKIVENGVEELSQSMKQASLQSEQRQQQENNYSPQEQRPKSPDVFKSFFGMLKQSTESLISKISKSNSPVHQPTSVDQPRNEESLKETLKRGIKSLRKHGDDAIDAKINEADKVPPEPSNISNQRTSNFCCEDVRLQFYSVVGDEEVRFYFPLDMDADSRAAIYSQVNAALISFYGVIIEHLGVKVFSLPSLQTLSIFYDPNSQAIAFNHNHSLFFNLAYFLANGHDKSPNSIQVRCFWFIIFCHELAHNFVAPHNAEHEFYMSTFLETYMPIFYSQIQIN